MVLKRWGKWKASYPSSFSWTSNCQGRADWSLQEESKRSTQTSISLCLRAMIFLSTVKPLVRGEPTAFFQKDHPRLTRFKNWWRGCAQNGHPQVYNLHGIERR